METRPSFLDVFILELDIVKSLNVEVFTNSIRFTGFLYTKLEEDVWFAESIIDLEAIV